MYDSFYNLTEKPFRISTDPRFLWLGEKHREALANLKYGLLDQNGLVVLTGDVGTGKTTLVNALLVSLDRRVSVAKISHPSLEALEFLTLIVKTFDPSAAINDKSDVLLFFNAFLNEAYADGKVVLLIIDEAHRLSMDLLEEIRLLSNIENAGQSLINIVFVGQNELKPMLLSPQCRALRQRITLFYDLQALSEEETEQYVRHRLKVAGVEEKLFLSEAIHQLFNHSRGNPRLINILCDRALLTGYVKVCKQIDAAIIIECAQELNLEEPHGIETQPAKPRFRAIATPDWKPDRIAGQAAVAVKAMQKAPATMKPFLDRQVTIGRQLFAWTRKRARKGWDAAVNGLGKYRLRIFPTAFVVGLVSFALIWAAGSLRSAGKQQDYTDVRTTGVSTEDEATQAVSGPDGEQAIMAQATVVESDPVSLSPIAVKNPILEVYLTSSLPWLGNIQPDVAQDSAAKDPESLAAASAALDRHQYQRALELVEDHFGDDPDTHPRAAGIYARALVGRAGELMAASPLEAEALLLKAVETDPDNAQVYLVLGKFYTRSRDYAKAIDAYRKTVDLDATASDAFFNLGYIYAYDENYEAAERAFSRCVELKPTYMGKSLFNLAVVQQKLGKKQESLANLESAVNIAPENQKAVSYLNRLKRSQEMGAGDREQ